MVTVYGVDVEGSISDRSRDFASLRYAVDAGKLVVICLCLDVTLWVSLQLQYPVRPVVMFPSPSHYRPPLHHPSVSSVELGIEFLYCTEQPQFLATQSCSLIIYVASFQRRHSDCLLPGLCWHPRSLDGLWQIRAGPTLLSHILLQVR